jgi:hypothetical protein
LIDFLEIPSEEKASHDIVLKIHNNMENISIVVYEEDPSKLLSSYLTKIAELMKLTPFNRN